MNNNSIYSVNFSGLTTLLTPPILRNPSMDAWTTVLASQSQIDNILFTQYLTGSTYPIFTSGSTYLKGNRVIGLNNGQNDAIYENLTGSTGVNFTDTNNWLQVNPSFIGSEERVMYNSQKIILEYALNRQYQILSQINNPTSWSGANHTNQIYISTNNVTSNRFIVSTTEVYSSLLANTGSLIFLNGGAYMGNTFVAPPQTEFVVNVPNLTLYTGVTNSSVSAYTQNYVIAGIQFSVSGY